MNDPLFVLCKICVEGVGEELVNHFGLAINLWLEGHEEF